MRHLNDKMLDQLLHGSLDEAGEQAVAEHASQCAACTARLREWQRVFPELERLIPESDPAGVQPTGNPNPQVVILPDWSPPPSPPRRAARRGAWILVLLLAGGAAYLLLRDREPLIGPRAPAATARPATTQSPPPDPAPPPAAIPADTLAQALGSGIAKPDTLTPDTTARPSPDPARTATVPQDQPRTPTREVASRTPPPATEPRTEPPREVPVSREEVTRFPIKVSDKPTRDGATNPDPPTTTVSGPLPDRFTRVTLGDAIARLGGSIRMIGGMTPEAVELAAGSVLPGAAPDRPVVRIIYSTPAGRVILDQQVVNRGGSREPDIAISTSESGVSVAQWVDWKGFWLSLAGHMTQENLLSLANRIE